MLLAIDTSTNLASVALVEAEDSVSKRDASGPENATLPAPSAVASAGLLAELTWEVGARHSVELLQRIEWLLASCGATMAQLTALAVATGPGSFNGARVAVATAKSLAFALSLPVSAHSTLDVIALGAGPAAGPRWALLDAGRGEVYAARYDAPPESADPAALAAWGPIALAAQETADSEEIASADAAPPDELTRYHLLTPQRLATLIKREAATLGAAPLVCGEWRAATQAALATALAAQGASPRYDVTPRRAWNLARLALARLAARTALINDIETLAALEPLYLRRPAITTSAKRALRSQH